MALSPPSHNYQPDAPAYGAFSITPSDANDLSRHIRGLLVGTAGDVQVTCLDGRVTVLPSLIAGIVHPVGALRVWATNTTALTIVGLW